MTLLTGTNTLSLVDMVYETFDLLLKPICTPEDPDRKERKYQ